MIVKVSKLIKRLIIAVFITLAVFTVLSLLPVFLAKTEKTDANILIVEGWLPQSALEKAVDEFHSGRYDYILTTGIKSKFEGCVLYKNGYLIFYPALKKSNSEPENHTIAASAYSELGGVHSACFRLLVNDSIMGDFTSSKKEEQYHVSWYGKLSELDSVIIQFYNDKTGVFGDRNLFVRDVIIDDSIKIPTMNHSAYDIGKLDGKKRTLNNIDSNALLTKQRLMLLGIDSASIIAIPGTRVKINRTLSSAIAVKEWVKTTDIEIKGMNIISSGTHSRRTWMTFSNVLNNKYKIGVVALPDYKNQKAFRKIIKTIRETTGLIYYRLLLFFV